MRKSYFLILMLMALMLSSALCGQSIKRSAKFSMSDVVERRTSPKDAAPSRADVPLSLAGEDVVSEFPFTFECGSREEKLVSFTLEQESMLKIVASSPLYDFYVDGISMPGSLELEMRLEAGEHTLECTNYEDEPFIADVSLGDRLYSSVGAPLVTDIDLPYSSGNVDFEAEADTVMVRDGLFTRAVFYRITDKGQLRMFNVKVADGTWYGYDTSAEEAAEWLDNESGINALESEAGRTAIYVAAYTPGETLGIGIEDMPVPMADDVYSDAEVVSLPYSAVIRTGSSFMYAPDDIDKEYPWYFHALKFTLANDASVYVSDASESGLMVRSGNNYFTAEEYDGYMLYRYNLTAGTYYYVCAGETPDTEIGRVQITTEKPGWLLDDYTEVDYSETLTPGKRYGEFRDGESPVIDDWDYGYVKGYTVELKAGHAYGFTYVFEAEDGGDADMRLLRSDMSGDADADLVMSSDYADRSCIMTVVPEEDAVYRLLLSSDNEYGDCIYSIEMTDMEKREHYGELTLPVDMDTVLRKVMAIDEEGIYLYGWKVTVDEPAYLRLSVEADDGNAVFDVMYGDPDAGSYVDVEGVLDEERRYVYALEEPGVYYLTAGSSYDGDVLHIRAEKYSMGNPVRIESLPYVSDELPAGVVRDGYTSLQYVWEYESDRDTLWTYMCVADGDTIAGADGFPLYCQSGTNTISLPAGQYEEFSLTVDFARDVERMTLGEYLDRVTDVTPLPAMLSGKIDASSPVIIEPEEMSEQLMDAYKVNVSDVSGVVFLEISDVKLSAENPYWWTLYVLRSTADGYEVVDVRSFDYLNTPWRVRLPYEGDYYVAVGSSCFDGYFAGSYEMNVEVNSAENVVSLKDLLDGVTEYTALPTVVSGTFDDTTPIVTEYGYSAVAYKLDVSSAVDGTRLLVSGQLDGYALLFKKDADGEYVVVEDIEGAGDYWFVLMHEIIVEGEPSADYRLNLKACSTPFMTVEELMSGVTSATALPATLQMEVKDGTARLSDGFNEYGLYSWAFRVDVSEEDLAGVQGVAVILSELTDAPDPLYYRVYRKEADNFILYDGEYIFRNGGASFNVPAGEYYVVVGSETSAADFSMNVSLEPLSLPDEENALTIVELLSQTTEDCPLPLNLDGRKLNETFVRGDGTFLPEYQYYFMDAYRVPFSSAANLIIHLDNIKYDGLYVGIYRGEDDGTYSYLDSWKLESSEVFTLSEYFGYLNGCYYIVVADASSVYGANTYDISLTQARDIEEKMRETTQAQTLPFYVSDELDMADLDGSVMMEGQIGAADVYRFEFKSGDNVSFRPVSKPDSYLLEGALYRYDEEADGFVPYGFQSDMDVYIDGIYYYVVFSSLSSVEGTTLPYSLTVGVAPERQIVVGITAEPSSVTVGDPDNELAVRMELAGQVTLTALTEQGERFGIPHSAFDWQLDEALSVATYTLPDDYEAMPGEEVKATVLINPRMVTVTATAGNHGSITPSGAVEVAAGQDKEFDISADYYNDYVIDEVFVDGIVVRSGLEGRSDGSYVLRGAADGMTLHVTFALSEARPLESFAVNVGVNDGTMGDVVVSGGEADDEGRYYNGSKLTLRAVPFNGYKFVKWSDGVTTMGREITVTEEITLTAEFSELETFSVEIVSEDEAMGRVEIDGDRPVVGDNLYAEGAELIVRAVSAHGYVFVRWSDGVTQAGRTLVVTDDINLVAHFEEETTSVETVSDDEPGFTLYSEHGILYIETEKTAEAVTVYDLSGRVLYRGMDRAINVGVPGVYVVVLDGESRKAAVR